MENLKRIIGMMDKRHEKSQDKAITVAQGEDGTGNGMNIAPSKPQRMLTRAEFIGLGEVPAVVEWLANIENKLTKEAYKRDVKQFMGFVGIENPEDFRLVTRSHIIAWRDQVKADGVAPATTRRKMSALSSLFDYLCEKNSIEGNPVNGVKRPIEGANVGKTPAQSKDQARALFNAPPEDTEIGLRDRAIIATFLLHGSRKMETAKLRLEDIQHREGVPHFQLHGKRGKIRYVAINPVALKRINDYLEFTGKTNPKEYLFTPTTNNSTKNTEKHLSAQGIYNVILKWGKVAGIPKSNLSVHALRTTAVTMALNNGSEIVDVQEWVGHSDISTTRMYYRGVVNVEDSPSFKVNL